ncbi:EscU/YscU/HrcU family type III secretion system export apparatus switch protein [Sphingomonas sp.]|jgi:flagellar biosynthetic protein FlhB|uniref:EscU/YscU/HrcU family type III secretion system export apparatus switch protein n=1 Tax=Sphingomonas sp. TaxID=28214 RepID=UPI002E30056D|nr:EscU/YscU/HrcU family type III secretion system export apparatus switch protein [Sphingomonas sp.]HEX4695782.1 EscU/YscU/HrcU family type III secretion system export apparatus switch protein [Sphingomonas sp.]
MAEGQEQNRTEAATPFKLKQARQKGMVARGLDLGFVAGLIGLAAFVIIAGGKLIAVLAVAMRRALTSGIVAAGDPGSATALAADSLWPVLRPVVLFGCTVVAVILAVEIVQLRGLVFSATPLTPDFSRLNPAKGLKRLFSAQMLKQAIKSILKMTIYTTIAILAIRAALAGAGMRITDASRLADTLDHAAMRMILLFILAAAGLAVVDQVLARGEFAKQMRMSRRDVTREHREREGDPRLRAKRKQAHAQFAKQSQGLGNLPGSDMLVVNPRHYAVALAYARDAGGAPVVTAKGADRHALQLRAAAARHGIPIIESRRLARALFRDGEMGREIAPQHFHAVAELYFKLGVTARA